jgi:hypothetical protein
MNEKQKKLNKAALVMLGLGILGCFFLNTASLLPGIAFLAAAVTHLTMLWGLKKALQYSAIAAVIGCFAEYISINTGLVVGSYYYNCNNFAMIAGVPLMVPVGYIYLVFIGQSLCYAICSRLIKKQNILIFSRGKLRPLGRSQERLTTTMSAAMSAAAMSMSTLASVIVTIVLIVVMIVMVVPMIVVVILVPSVIVLLGSKPHPVVKTWPIPLHLGLTR